MEKEKVYLVCDHYSGNVDAGALNIGVEYLGDCSGRILKEDGTEIGHHWSSTFGWLRHDLKRNLDDPNKYEIIDLIGQEVPERFKKKEICECCDGTGMCEDINNEIGSCLTCNGKGWF